MKIVRQASIYHNVNTLIVAMKMVRQASILYRNVNTQIVAMKMVRQASIYRNVNTQIVNRHKFIAGQFSCDNVAWKLAGYEFVPVCLQTKSSGTSLISGVII